MIYAENIHKKAMDATKPKNSIGSDFIWEKAETKVAIFYINDIEFQLCESLGKNGRFTRF